MNEKALRILEYPKIREMLVACAGSFPGRQKCQALLPSQDLQEVQRMQTETADALRRIYEKGSVSFSGVKDMRADIARLQIGGSLSITELLDIAKLLETAARVKSWEDKPSEKKPEPAVVEDGAAHWTKNRQMAAEEAGAGAGRRESGEEADQPEKDSLTELFCDLEPVPSLVREIRRCILSEDEIADDASVNLRRIRRQISLSEERIHSQLQQMVNGPARAFLQDAVITQRDGRYCLPVRSEYRSQVPGMIHDQSASGQTIFVEPMTVVKLNNDIRTLEAEEKKEIEKILQELSEKAAEQSDALISDIQILSELDFIFARAVLAKKMNATQPDFNEQGIVDIRRARHPLIDRRRVVPVDIRLGEDFDQLVISGPNTGGKTVSLKTIGLLEIMGLSGLHIPAKEHSRLSMFTEIYADIGDEQSIEQSLSTFSSHMTNIVSFWEAADEKSLVLFDELGAGTDPEEGAALAISILAHLHSRGIRTVATTHYSEVKIYALSTDGVENACCEFDVATLRPTYRLLIGVPGKSNAFAISKRLGLPDEIIEDAKGRIADEQESFESVISDLESRRVSMEKAESAMTKDQAEIRRLRRSLEEQEKKLAESKDKILEKARQQAADLLRDTKQYADETIRAFNKMSGNAISARDMERRRTALRGKMDEMESSRKKEKEKTPHKAVDARKLQVGDSVKVLSLNLKGIVRSLPDKSGNIDVQMGILHSVVNVKDIELLDEVSIKGPSYEHTATGKVRISKSVSVSPEINLLGMTVDEAVSVLDKYLDDAAIAHLDEVRVVHGKGTGALRAGVQNFLRKNKHVQSYRLGEYGEGDAGVTIVKLK
ncbi:endonuclease MutS2 [Porcincola intestinalis]|uniref:endonuclease MutS2 n=1 Tax=Porcincola intestinalis TaxID=2606632 RepID=UPI0023F49058|nr:endonuclease MutS2 [Porcincola intestinalis]MCI6766730.1 endonuclease MutS2 [Lachnospiraceae bacterium]MDD7059636.1 endonuclease MutS2 [Porcincola intestinalis]MDY5283635.1 endonuclease MutS2 [Porcincola intestinalis]